ncbi:hypothetical protein [Halosimplex halobium]|uniref:hypothetical protein n=1 Tax=Halosimplex halobium TaxID=3396618 RepID=UPI003F563939
MLEVVADLAHVAGRAADDLREALAADRLEGLALGVGLAVVDEAVVPRDALVVDVLDRRVEVRLEVVHRDVFEFRVVASAGLPPAEDVDDGELVVAAVLDGVVDLRDRQRDRALRVGEPDRVGVDHRRGAAAVLVACDGFGLVGGPLLAGPEVPELRLLHVTRRWRGPTKIVAVSGIDGSVSPVSPLSLTERV